MIALFLNNQQKLEPDKYAIWYGLLAFGLLTSLLVTIVRSGSSVNGGSADTIYFIPAVRHSLGIFLPLVCLYILAVIYTINSFKYNSSVTSDCSHPMNILRQQKFINLFLLLMILAMVIGGFLLHIPLGIRQGEKNYSERSTDEKILLNYSIATDDELKRLFPNPGHIRVMASQLEKYNLSVFSQHNPAST